MQQFSLMNILYADQAGNIFYLYNGLIPRRDDAFDRTLPLDGADRADRLARLARGGRVAAIAQPSRRLRAELQLQPVHDLLATSNPQRAALSALPGRRRRRRQAPGAALAANARRHARPDVRAASSEAAFDTTVYWAKEELPKYAAQLEKLKTDRSGAGRRSRALSRHLLDWDCRITADSTAATLCDAWYSELYGRDYPGETHEAPLREGARAAVSRPGQGGRRRCSRCTANGACPGANCSACSGPQTWPT